jgi:hypothetical protein
MHTMHSIREFRIRASVIHSSGACVAELLHKRFVHATQGSFCCDAFTVVGDTTRVLEAAMDASLPS